MKIVVIGAGPGGYTCAIRLAQLGTQVTVIEAAEVGGTCLNVGCIPTKALLHSAEVYKTVKTAQSAGISCDNVSLDWQTVQQNKDAVVKKLCVGVEGLFKSNGVSLVKGRARLIPGSCLEVVNDQETHIIEFDKAVIACGSKPATPRIEGAELDGVVSSDGALSFEQVPQRLVIIGGGVIGMEFAEVYSAFGSEVTVIEALSDVLATMDSEIVSAYKRTLREKKISVVADARVTKIIKSDDAPLQVHYCTEKGEEVKNADKVLMATGRMAYTAGLGLENAGITVDGKGRIEINKKTLQTANANIYAIGDCVDMPQLAHAAAAQGVAAAEVIMGMPERGETLEIVPQCVYTSPELAGVGFTERQAVDAGFDIEVGRFPVTANGRSMTAGEKCGMAKVIAEKSTGKIIGVHLCCHSATEIISEAVNMISSEQTLKDAERVIHAHPTVSEILGEALLDAGGIALNIPPRAAVNR